MVLWVITSTGPTSRPLRAPYGETPGALHTAPHRSAVWDTGAPEFSLCQIGQTSVISVLSTLHSLEHTRSSGALRRLERGAPDTYSCLTQLIQQTLRLIFGRVIVFHVSHAETLRNVSLCSGLWNSETLHTIEISSRLNSGRESEVTRWQCCLLSNVSTTSQQYCDTRLRLWITPGNVSFSIT